MNLEETVTAINEQQPTFLQRARKRGFICPLCGSGSHSRGTGIEKYTGKDGKTRYHCLACNEINDDTIGVWQKTHEGMGYMEAVKTAAEYYGIAYDGSTPEQGQSRKPAKRKAEQKPNEEEMEITLTDQTEFYRAAHNELMNSPAAEDARQYLKKRGITRETAERFNLGYCSAWRPANNPAAVPSNRLIIPRSPNSYSARDIDGVSSAKYIVQGRQEIFNGQALDAAEPCFITEGEIDVLSIEQAGGHAMAMGSATNIKRTVETVKQAQLKSPIIVALDNDKAGETASGKLTRELRDAGINATAVNPYGDCKDANELLTTSPEALKEAIQSIYEKMKDLPAYIETSPETAQNEPVEVSEEEQRAAYLQTSAAGCMADFGKSISERASIKPIATGYSALDKALDGGLYEGLYCIGAISSLGKTTFIMQLADQVANGGNDVLIFSLEMSKYELIAKSLSRLTFVNSGATEAKPYNGSIAFTTRGILDGSRYSTYSGEQLQAIEEAKETYSTYAKHLYIHEGIGDIGVNRVREDVARHIRFTGNRPLVIVDYMQILAPYDIHATDKQNTDRTVLELKRISRDFKLPVIAISSFNRDSYGKGATGEVRMNNFKESGAIEYSADVLIGLQFTSAGQTDEKGKPIYDEEKERAENPRAVTLKVMKNRNGRIGGKVNYLYYTAFNYFKETAERSI